MCGRYASPNRAAIVKAFHPDELHGVELQLRFNVAPSTPVPILLVEGGRTLLTSARWGLIPAWWKKSTPPSLTFNARSEEAAEKPTWRASYRAQRCLMPALGWYEWCETEPVRNAAGRKVHQPYYLHATDEGLIAFAGLWATWRNPAGEEVLSCALLSREAAPGIHAIHHRMPAVLAPEAFADWLSPETPVHRVAELIAASRQDFVGHRVSLRVNSPRNDDPGLLDPVLPADEPLL